MADIARALPLRGLIATVVTVTAALIPIAEHAPAHAEGTVTLLAINDVYRLHGADDGAVGGMPRVRALRAALEDDDPELVFLHGGDFLSPSFLGRTYKGAQMIDLMNVMDGAPEQGRFDARMFTAFGNHEFDDTHCTKPGPLEDLVAASEFTWLASNLDFAQCEPLAGLAGHERIAPRALIEANGVRLGLFGVTLAKDNYADIVRDPVAAACAETQALRAAGADIVVGVTHLDWQDDLLLLGFARGGAALAAGERPCAEPPDLIIGGHDHVSLALPSAAPRLFKADADAVSAWVVRVTRSDGEISLQSELVVLDGGRSSDPLALRLADMWLERHDEQYCTRDCIGREGDDLKTCMGLAANGACLAQEIARTASLIETEELVNRSDETGFGDWVADLVRDAGQADVGFLNAGGFRLNYNISAGHMVTRRHLEQMFPFVNRLAVREVPAAVLWGAMETALAHRGEGPWAHFSGLAARVETVSGGQRLAELMVRLADGSLLDVTPETKTTVTVASVSFVLANGDGHGFDVCPGLDDIWACKDAVEADPQWPLQGDGADLSGFVRLKLLDLGDAPLELSTDNRLCDPGDTDCLIERWKEEG